MNSEIRATESKYMPLIERIVKQHFNLFPQDVVEVKLSTEEEDTKESFDLVYSARMEISVRIRKNYALRYSDFTIRYKSRSGYATEIDKLRSGKGTVYLYAWEREAGDGFASYVLVDINKIRHLFSDVKGSIKDNQDGTLFMAYSLHQIKEGIIHYEKPKQLWQNY